MSDPNTDLHTKISYDDSKSILVIDLIGDWQSISEIPSIKEIIDSIKNENLEKIKLVSSLSNWDSKLVVYVQSIINISKEHSIKIDTANLDKGILKLIKLSEAVPIVDNNNGDPSDQPILSRIGDISISVTSSAGDILTFIGETTKSFLRFFTFRAKFRKSDLWLLIQEAGANALPIVTLINFLIGVILAFVGSIQLQQFGASIFIADLVGIAMVREMAPMMTAIIIAGRSGASYAAQLGTMTVNEEIDALKTFGFDPIDFLVLPRMLALGLMMPLLALYADFIGIIGGAIVGIGMLDITIAQFVEQTRQALSPLQFGLGLIKATIYGILVALAGCMKGMECGRSASAVGSATTAAVVTGIIFIITASAITTVIYSAFGY